MKEREVIELYHWVDGSGFSHSETFENKIIEIKEIKDEMDWSWWEADEEIEGKDIKIVVTYYAEDDEYLEKPIISYIAWESDLRENGLYEVEVYNDYDK